MPPLLRQIMGAWCALMLIAAAAALGDRPHTPRLERQMAAASVPAEAEPVGYRYPTFSRAASADSSMSSM